MSDIIKIIHSERKNYYSLEKYHYVLFAFYTLILVVDVLFIIFLQSRRLDAFSWLGIIFLITLLFVEAHQVLKFRDLKQNVDNWYLEGELNFIKKRKNG